VVGPGGIAGVHQLQSTIGRRGFRLGTHFSIEPALDCVAPTPGGFEY
jgi:hypothetical protein